MSARTAGILVLLAHGLSAQTSLSISSDMGRLGSIIPLYLSLSALTGNEPASLEWTLAYPAGDVALSALTAGPALIAAGKSLNCHSETAAVTCLATGMNSNPIGSGIVAVVTIAVAPSTGSSQISVAVGGTLGAFSDGTLAAVSGTGGSIALLDWRPFVPAYFTDVSPSDPIFTAANILYARGISYGCSSTPLMYCPNNNLTRGQMATLLIQTVLGSRPTNFRPEPYFVDVPASHEYFGWIQKLYELGITAGCQANPAKFCPEDTVTRANIAAFTVRGRYGPGTPFTYPSVLSFTDVLSGDPYFPSVQKMAQLGIPGCSPRTYCPTNAMTRGEMALFLVRGVLNQLLPAGTPVLSSVAPSIVLRGTAISVWLSGINTHFSDGLSVYAGSGISVTAINVLDAQNIVATLSVSQSAAPGPRSVIVTNGSEDAVLPNGLSVQ